MVEFGEDFLEGGLLVFGLELEAQKGAAHLFTGIGVVEAAPIGTPLEDSEEIVEGTRALGKYQLDAVGAPDHVRIMAEEAELRRIHVGNYLVAGYAKPFGKTSTRVCRTRAM